MEFADILAEIIALLQHQGRISYGALKRRFTLDDDYLTDLKIELIEAQPRYHHRRQAGTPNRRRSPTRRRISRKRF
jgi:hypothetical protein